MTNLKELSNALTLALGDENLHALAIEPGEQILDSLLTDGVARDIPVIGTIYGLCKVGSSVADRLFCKKLLHFLSGIADVPPKERATVISRIDGDGRYQIKVGEKLLYILDKADDHETARIVAYLFAAFLSGELLYGDFLRASRGVQNIMTVDLWRFVDDENKGWDICDAQDLLNTGFVAFDGTEIRVEDHYSVQSKDTQKYDVEGGELTASITELGEKVRTILRSRRSARRKPTEAFGQDGHGAPV